MKTSSTGGKRKPVPLNYRSDCDNKDYPVTLLITSYRSGNLVIMLQTEVNGETEDFELITVNFPDELLSPDQAYLDTNNVPGIEQFIEKHQLGKPNGKKKISGFCTYPLYEFDLIRCLEHGALADS